MSQLAGKLHNQEANHLGRGKGTVWIRQKAGETIKRVLWLGGRRSSAREALFLGLRGVDAFPPIPKIPDYWDLSSSIVMI
jgi:hypothetical protein